MRGSSQAVERLQDSRGDFRREAFPFGDSVNPEPPVALGKAFLGMKSVQKRPDPRGEGRESGRGDVHTQKHAQMCKQACLHVHK